MQKKKGLNKIEFADWKSQTSKRAMLSNYVQVLIRKKLSFEKISLKVYICI